MASSGRQTMPIGGIQFDSDDDTLDEDEGNLSPPQTYSRRQSLQRTASYNIPQRHQDRLVYNLNPSGPGTRELTFALRPPLPNVQFDSDGEIFHGELQSSAVTSVGDSQRGSQGPLNYKRTQSGQSEIEAVCVAAFPVASGATFSPSDENLMQETVGSSSQSSGSATASANRVIGIRPNEASEMHQQIANKEKTAHRLRWHALGQKVKDASRLKKFLVSCAVILFIIVVAVVVAWSVACGGGGCLSSGEADSSTLSNVKARGILQCGISDSETVLGGKVPLGRMLCDAIAAGIFGTAEGHTMYATVTPLDRFVKLQNGDVDVFTGATHTMEREVLEPSTGEAFSFSTPFRYEGLAFGGLRPFGTCADNLISSNTTSLDCRGMVVCVVDGTTFQAYAPGLLPGARFVVSPDSAAVYRNLRDGLCNTIAGDQVQTSVPRVSEAGIREEDGYEQGRNTFTREPLSIVTRSDDPTFSDFTNWIIQALLSAEEQNIGKTEASSIPRTDLFGGEFENVFVNAVRQVGNYAELYNSTLQGIVPRSNINTINDASHGSGLIHAAPFGNLQRQGSRGSRGRQAAPTSSTGPLLSEIRNRGVLNCGVDLAGVFANVNPLTNELEGFDVDFCKAVAAAVFCGTTGEVNYVLRPRPEGFRVLSSREADVLSRFTTHNLERDVKEASTGVGFSFSPVNFYDGLTFGGIPPFHTCAGNQDILSPECQNIRICVSAGTTSIARVLQLFPRRVVVPQQSTSLTARGLEGGICNVVAGSLFETTESHVRNIGLYNGPYAQAEGLFSKDPLALVTRQDDPQWSSFVYWVVSAIFYAEQEGITKMTGARMPTVSLFGPGLSTMFQDVISEVGSYGEIYKRHIESELPREGLNQLNTIPFQAQHYALPGLER